MKLDDARFLDYCLKAGFGILLLLAAWHFRTYYKEVMDYICY
ncbi:MAG: hypothetical protein JWP57_1542 [Spirosoma sp.]|nr:hypothetical protein [Spirosoma sp.]